MQMIPARRGSSSDGLGRATTDFELSLRSSVLTSKGITNGMCLTIVRREREREGQIKTERQRDKETEGQRDQSTGSLFAPIAQALSEAAVAHQLFMAYDVLLSMRPRIQASGKPSMKQLVFEKTRRALQVMWPTGRLVRTRGAQTTSAQSSSWGHVHRNSISRYHTGWIPCSQKDSRALRPPCVEGCPSHLGCQTPQANAVSMTEQQSGPSTIPNPSHSSASLFGLRPPVRCDLRFRTDRSLRNCARNQAPLRAHKCSDAR